LRTCPEGAVGATLRERFRLDSRDPSLDLVGSMVLCGDATGSTDGTSCAVNASLSRDKRVRVPL